MEQFKALVVTPEAKRAALSASTVGGLSAPAKKPSHKQRKERKLADDHGARSICESASQYRALRRASDIAAALADSDADADEARLRLDLLNAVFAFVPLPGEVSEFFSPVARQTIDKLRQ